PTLGQTYSAPNCTGCVVELVTVKKPNVTHTPNTLLRVVRLPMILLSISKRPNGCGAWVKAADELGSNRRSGTWSVHVVVALEARSRVLLTPRGPADKASPPAARPVPRPQNGLLLAPGTFAPPTPVSGLREAIRAVHRLATSVA